MRSTVNRVHIRLEAPSEDDLRALEIRSRLERTARVHLADALERALGTHPERRAFVERVHVTLDFDLENLDDVTLATLWADRVRGALEKVQLAHGDGVEIFESDAAFYAAAVIEYAEHGSLRGIFAELSCGAGAPPPLSFFSAFDTEARVLVLARTLATRTVLARAIHDRLAPAARAATRLAFLGLASWPPVIGANSTTVAEGASATGSAHAPNDRAAAGGASLRSDRTLDQAPPRDAASPASGASDDERSLEQFHEALRICAERGARSVAFAATVTPAPNSPSRSHRRSASIREPRASHEAPTLRASESEPRRPDDELAPATDRHDASADRRFLDDPDLRTSVGGLVLLYPWLADLLAPADVPEHLVESYRRHALAAVGGDERLVLDHLVSLLAGVDPTDESSELAELPDDLAHRISGDADATIRSFAALLPGFEASSPTYLRTGLIVRAGTLRPLDDESWSVRLGPAPLDPILFRLPYPLGPFRFAWSQVIHVSLIDA
ncbi:MAG: hypothetical protein JWM74_4969 [Myxococcaceae bacterium]|nr:hypothetical protein [Myxococcaceae bacterium]